MVCSDQLRAWSGPMDTWSAVLRRRSCPERRRMCYAEARGTDPIPFNPSTRIVADRIVIPREERYLERKFGKEYLNYKRRVRRWI